VSVLHRVIDNYVDLFVEVFARKAWNFLSAIHRCNVVEAVLTVWAKLRSTAQRISRDQRLAVRVDFTVSLSEVLPVSHNVIKFIIQKLLELIQDRIAER
jgi:hypothetical protein